LDTSERLTECQRCRKKCSEVYRFKDRADLCWSCWQEWEKVREGAWIQFFMVGRTIAEKAAPPAER